MKDSLFVRGTDSRTAPLSRAELAAIWEETNAGLLAGDLATVSRGIQVLLYQADVRKNPAVPADYLAEPRFAPRFLAIPAGIRRGVEDRLERYAYLVARRSN